MPECPFKYICQPGSSLCPACTLSGNRYMAEHRYIPNSGIPARYCPPDISPIELLDSCSRKLRVYVKDLGHMTDTGQSLYLWSKGPGTGKTTMACSLLMKYLLIRGKTIAISDWTHPVGYFTVVDLMDSLRRNMKEPSEEFEELWGRQFSPRAPRLLVLDDLGAEKPSEWVRERLYQLINYRYSNRLSTIYTSNCDRETIYSKLGDRIGSRVFSSLVVEMAGTDQRRFGNG